MQIKKEHGTRDSILVSILHDSPQPTYARSRASAWRIDCSNIQGPHLRRVNLHLILPNFSTWLYKTNKPRTVISMEICPTEIGIDGSIKIEQLSKDPSMLTLIFQLIRSPEKKWPGEPSIRTRLSRMSDYRFPSIRFRKKWHIPCMYLSHHHPHPYASADTSISSLFGESVM